MAPSPLTVPPANEFEIVPVLAPTKPPTAVLKLPLPLMPLALPEACELLIVAVVLADEAADEAAARRSTTLPCAEERVDAGVVVADQAARVVALASSARRRG